MYSTSFYIVPLKRWNKVYYSEIRFSNLHLKRKKIFFLFLTFHEVFLIFPPFCLSGCPLSNCSGHEEQLQFKPDKLTLSLWISHMHYSNQSTLDHPDTLDIWVSVSPHCPHLFLLFSVLCFLYGRLTAVSLQRAPKSNSATGLWHVFKSSTTATYYRSEYLTLEKLIILTSYTYYEKKHWQSS